MRKKKRNETKRNDTGTNANRENVNMYKCMYVCPYKYVYLWFVSACEFSNPQKKWTMKAKKKTENKSNNVKKKGETHSLIPQQILVNWISEWINTETQQVAL